jgi:hypothetical protein
MRPSSAARRAGAKLVALLYGLLLASCASAPPGADARQSALLAAAVECAAGRPGLTVQRIDPDGRVRVAVGPGGQRQIPAFNACYAEKADARLSRAHIVESPAVASSTPARMGARVTVPIRMVNRKVLVPVVLNGAPSRTFILDTGANVTVISPALAGTLGFAQVPGEARGTARMASGQEVEVTARRLASISVGAARIENFGVVIYDLAGVTRSVGPDIVVDGLLGIDFIGRFTTTIDLRNQTLTFQLDEPPPR